MKSYYSIIRFVNNPLSKENLAIGMIVISGSDIFYKFSEGKINLAEKINPSNSKLLNYTVKKISNFIEGQLKEEVSLFSREVSVNLDYLKRLAVYNNGFLQFDPPSIINTSFDQMSFSKFFKRFIELHQKPSSKAVVDEAFKRTIKNVFYEPLQNVIDLEYRVKKEQIPSLFFDYTLDGIGVNGSIYTVKAVDLNSGKDLDFYKKTISDLESLNYRLDRFSKENGLNDDKKHHYLVIDPYKGSKPSYQKLHDILMEQRNWDYPYSVISTNELPKVTAKIADSNSIKKFSEFLKDLA